MSAPSAIPAMPRPRVETRLCQLLGIQHPIVLAGMPGIAGPELTAAVSNAGGLGMLAIHAHMPDELRALIRRTRELTDRPFGVFLTLPDSRSCELPRPGQRARLPADELVDCLEFAESFMEQHGLELQDESGPPGAIPLCTPAFLEAHLQVVIEEQVPVFSVGLGTPLPDLEALHDHGILVIAPAGTVRDAVRLATAGVDVVVAQGHEAGGPNTPVGTLPLVPQVVDALGPGLPVLAGGGIGDGRGVAAALMLGAQGAWIGTAFLAAHEARLPDFQRCALIGAGDDSTVVSRSITGQPLRTLRSRWTDTWERTELEPLAAPYQARISRPVLAAALSSGRADIHPGTAGPAAGMIRSIRPTSKILADLVSGARAALDQPFDVVAHPPPLAQQLRRIPS
ncbi:MAG: NAD(P)H-dependent flavin oxidoreductase [Pseudomonadales bacterium]